MTDTVKLAMQLVMLGVLGGAVSWYYSKIQKQRELRITLLKDFSHLHESPRGQEPKGSNLDFIPYNS
jgi:hypothetical protein